MMGTRCKKITVELENGVVYEVSRVTTFDFIFSILLNGTEGWELTAGGMGNSTARAFPEKQVSTPLPISRELVKDKEVEWGFF